MLSPAASLYHQCLNRFYELARALDVTVDMPLEHAMTLQMLPDMLEDLTGAVRELFNTYTCTSDTVYLHRTIMVPPVSLPKEICKDDELYYRCMRIAEKELVELAEKLTVVRHALLLVPQKYYDTISEHISAITMVPYPYPSNLIVEFTLPAPPEIVCLARGHDIKPDDVKHLVMQTVTTMLQAGIYVATTDDDYAYVRKRIRDALSIEVLHYWAPPFSLELLNLLPYLRAVYDIDDPSNWRRAIMRTIFLFIRRVAWTVSRSLTECRRHVRQLEWIIEAFDALTDAMQDKLNELAAELSSIDRWKQH